MKYLTLLAKVFFIFGIGFSFYIMYHVIFTNFQMSTYDQVVALFYEIGVFIYWLKGIIAYDKKRRNTELLRQLEKDLSHILENLHRLSEKEAMHRVLSKNTVSNEGAGFEEGEDKVYVVKFGMQDMRNPTDTTVAKKEQRKVSKVSKSVRPKTQKNTRVK